VREAYHFLELAGELDVAEVHQVLLSGILVVGERVKRVVVEFALVLLLVPDSYIFINKQHPPQASHLHPLLPADIEQLQTSG
jgi:hypothetical protein